MTEPAEIVEGPEDDTERPVRRSLSRSRGVFVGVDVGGTKVLAGVVSSRGRVVRTARRSTPGRRVSPEMVEDAVVAAVREAAGDAPLRGVGVAAAGFVDGDEPARCGVDGSTAMASG